MKKFLTAVVLATGILFANNVNAQTKIGYIKIDDIVGLMPELAKTKVNMDTVGQKFVEDSIMPRLRYIQGEREKKILEYADSTKPAAVRELILKDLQGYNEELSGADAYIQQVLQYKQQEYLQPYYAKAKKAIDQVAKEKGYTHVFSTDVFLVAPQNDDMSLMVLAKLGIKLPEQPKAPAGK
jgi:outer membrane protein